MIKRNITKSSTLHLSILFTLLLFVLASVVTYAATITQGYSSESPLQRGMIVGLKDNDPRSVEPINSDEYERLHGVVITANDSAVLLGREDDKVYVASGGPFQTLVSSQNGSIKPGDYVAVSSLRGIGMRAGESEPVIVGKAVDEFDPGNRDHIISTARVQDQNGSEQQLVIGLINVDIGISANPLLKSNNELPDALRRASEAIAGKPVSPVRVYLSLAVLLMATAISGSLIYSAVRSSVIAIGRNPLSKRSIMRGLFQVVIIGIIVFLSGVFGVYLILNL